MMCYRDQSYCSDHEECATMECERRLTERDNDYLMAYPYIPVGYMSFKETCGKYEVKI